MTSVRCGKCGRNNVPEARFCIYCGSRLTPVSPELPVPDQATADEIRQLRDLVAQINSRLDALEGKLGPAAAPAPPPVPITEPIAPAAVTPEPEPLPETTATVPEIEVPPMPAEEERPAKKGVEWEQVLGGNWLARIGVLAIIIGIGFFLKYAFDNNWISPSARVILGVIAGLIMLGLGYYWRQRYPIMTRVLSGGGIAVLYLSIFASFATYHLISVYIAVVLLFIISGIATALALRYDSMALAILGILGAFFAPFILGAFGEGDAADSTRGKAIQLLVYLIVVDAGVLVLSAFRNWRWFTLLALACSLITYGFWYGEFNNRVGIAAEEIGITAIFLSFVGATYLFHIAWRRVPRAFDYFLMLGNAAAYAGISLSIMWDEFRDWMGGFVLLLALFYGLLAYLAYRRNREDTRLAGFSLAIALIFITVAIPVQFRDHAATAIAWAIELLALVWLSFKLKLPVMRYCGYAVFVVMFWWLLISDTKVEIATFKPVLNERFLAYIIAIAATYLAANVLWRQRASVAGEWRGAGSVFLIGASFLLLWLVSFEAWQSFTNPITAAGRDARKGLENAQNLSLTAVWAVYAVAGLAIGIWRKWRYVRIGCLALLVIPIVKVFVYDVFTLETSYRIGAFVGLGLLLLISAYLYQRYSKIIKGVFTAK
jgi:uncharacterized membrane protein